MRIRVLLIVLSMFCMTWAVAQDDAKKADTEKKASKAKQSDKSKESVYTKEDLRDQLDETAKSSSVIYNDNLKGKSAGGSSSSATVFTNDTLTQRYGVPEPAPEPRAGDGTTEPSTGSAPDGDAATDPNAEPDAQSDTEPAMSSAERTQRIAKVEAELKRLERRTLALKNPLLAGTVPPTDEERTNEKGMNNSARLENNDSRIAELKAKLQELQSGK